MKRRKPIVCSLSAADRKVRGDRWRRLISQWSGRIAVARNGVTIRFDDPRIWAELQELVALERRCCEWMRLDLSVDGGGLLLTVGAEHRDGAAAIRNMMAFGAEPVSSDSAR
jgi:hypothetical protein